MDRYDVVIVGGGIMGLLAACELADKREIALVDQQNIVGAQNSSNDYSRVFRTVGDNAFLSELQVESLKLWKEFEHHTKAQIYFPCGALLLGDSEESYALKGYRTAQALGNPAVLLEGSALTKRFPQFRSRFGVFDSAGGLLEARRAVMAAHKLCNMRGVHFYENAHVEKIDGREVQLTNGDRVTGTQVVLTSGAWSARLLPAQVPKLRITEQHIYYLQTKNADLFTKTNCPIFGFIDDGFYGIPIHGIEAVKIASHVSRDEVPYPKETKSDLSQLESIQRLLEQRIPALVDAKLIEEKVCFYDMSQDGSFIIDRVDEVLSVGVGFCGMGFKFAPVIARTLANVVNGTEESPEAFQLKRFKHMQSA